MHVAPPERGEPPVVRARRPVLEHDVEPPLPEAAVPDDPRGLDGDRVLRERLARSGRSITVGGVREERVTVREELDRRGREVQEVERGLHRVAVVAEDPEREPRELVAVAEEAEVDEAQVRPR